MPANIIETIQSMQAKNETQKYQFESEDLNDIEAQHCAINAID